MEQVRVTITTSTPVSVRVIRQSDQSGLAKLARELKKTEVAQNVAKAKK